MTLADQIDDRLWTLRDELEEEGLIDLAREVEEIGSMVRDLAADNEALAAKIDRGDFSKEEIHNWCHNLHGKVNAEEFAAGCEAEQRRLYGCAPDVDTNQKLRVELAATYEKLRLVKKDASRLEQLIKCADVDVDNADGIGVPWALYLR